MSVLTTSETGNGHSFASHSDLAAERGDTLFCRRILAANSLLSEQRDVRRLLWPILLCFVLAATLSAEDWRTGSDFREALESTTNITVAGSPIRDSLQRLGRSQAVALFLDRRVDPTGELTISTDRQSLDRVIRRIARQNNLGVGYVGPVVYVGPPLTAARISTLAALKNQQAKKLAATLAAKMLTKKPLAWPKLSEPRWIARKLCAEAGLKLPTAKVIPHDLWLAGDYPPMTLAERLTLVLAGFGMTYAVDEQKRQLHLKGIPRALAVERVYTTRVDVNRIIPVLRKDYPGAFIRGAGNELRVRSTIEDQWAIEAYLSPPQRSRRSANGQPLYTLTVKEQPLGKLVEQISSRLALQVEYGQGANKMKDQRVSFSVTNVTAEELFQAVVGPADLSATLDGDVVQIE